ncbi:hypothetical protein A5649_13420 [Mycolicibacter heraklionensis]|uniref:Uncharacterized protein n=1 Tax=Mycolicibacter heraklionensis TaxID=512402 RepID=A0AA91EYI9_9MYCO|nr:hypothetical protein [Mycolicibacter heraklionensis]OBK89446.1 hypothetical protein A5649_13420 [Mycolicibacter heraklionensis]
MTALHSVKSTITPDAHDVTARYSTGSRLWLTTCVCGWWAMPCHTTEEADVLGELHYEHVADIPGDLSDAAGTLQAMTAARPDLVDVGPATPPPAWFPPDALPDWQDRTTQRGVEQFCEWSRDVADGVAIACSDVVVAGRVMRSTPRVHMTDEPPAAGWTVQQAREVAARIIAAADFIDQASVIA